MLRFAQRDRKFEAVALCIALAAGIVLVIRLDAPSRSRSPRAVANPANLAERRASLHTLGNALSSADALRNPQPLLFGVHDPRVPADFSRLTELEQQLGVAFPIISFTVAWGDKPDQRFPTDAIQAIDQRGSVPLITWEPWVTNFRATPRNQLPPRGEREYRSLAAIARGAYDFYIKQWATDAARYGKPVFIRFAHEMNEPYRHPWGPQNGNRPEDFIAAWRYLHLLFRTTNATNVLWVWSPHISVPWFEYYFPGPEYVDWIGIEALNYGTTASWSRWWSLPQIIDKPYGVLASMQKPIMITDFGTVAAGGDMAEWYRDAFTNLDRVYDRIHGVILRNDTATPNWSVVQNPRAATVVAEELSRRIP